MKKYFKEHIEPNLYLASLWLCIASAISIFLNDPFRGSAVASALTLYYLINGFYRSQMYKEQMQLQLKVKLKEESWTDDQSK